MFQVILKRHEASTRPDVIAFYDEDREKAISFIHNYVKNNGFTLHDIDGHFTIANVLLVERDMVVDAPVKSVKEYRELFDISGNRITEK